MAETLYDLKAGDEVVIEGSGRGDPYRLVQVSRATATQLLTSSGRDGRTERWRKKTGRIVGGGPSEYYWRRLHVATPELREKVQRYKAIAEIEGCVHRLEKAARGGGRLAGYPACAVSAILEHCKHINTIMAGAEGTHAN